MSLAEIKSRGHWVAIVRPPDFIETRLENVMKLDYIVRESAVDLRDGWDFPFYDTSAKTLVREQDYIQQDFDWSHFKEFWQFYLSGQFVFISSLWGEWRDLEPKSFQGIDPSLKVLFIYDPITKWTELLLFTSKLMRHLNVDEMEIEVSFNDLNERRLAVGPNRLPFFPEKVATAKKWSKTLRLKQSELSVNYKKIAIELSKDLFTLFNWDASEEILEGIQKETLSRLNR